MYYDVTIAQVINDYTLKVKFLDNLEGIVKISKAWLTVVFTPLQNMQKFRQVYVNKESGAITWDVDGDQIDLAPDTMYPTFRTTFNICVFLLNYKIFF